MTVNISQNNGVCPLPLEKYLLCAYQALPVSHFAPLSTCVGFQAQPAAGLHWKLLNRHLMDHCFPEKQGKY